MMRASQFFSGAPVAQTKCATGECAYSKKSAAHCAPLLQRQRRGSGARADFHLIGAYGGSFAALQQSEVK